MSIDENPLAAFLFVFADERTSVCQYFMVVYEQHSLRATSGAATATELCTRCKYRRLFGAAGVFHPSFSFLENSAHEIRDLHPFTLRIRRAVFSQARSALVSPSFFLSSLSSRRISFPRLSFLYPRDADRCFLMAPPESIDDRISIREDLHGMLLAKQ